MQFTSSTAAVTVDPMAGGRLAELVVHGHSVLVARDHDPMRWGSYPMVPFAGRIRHGRFTFDGLTHELPVNLGPHAIHGYGYTEQWDVIDDQSIGWDFSGPWPYAGRAVQRFALTDSHLQVSLQVTAHERQPLMAGWHPWFRRRLDNGAPVVLDFGAASMYQLDYEAIPTGELVVPPPGPWDNCFTGLERGPALRWGVDELVLRLSSTADHWVVFTEPEHAVCVEPQSGAPDEINRRAPVFEAGKTLETVFTISW